MYDGCCLAIPCCDGATSKALSSCCSYFGRLLFVNLSLLFHFFDLLFPSLFYDSVLWSHSHSPSSEWPQQTLTRTFHWHQLHKTINMLRSVSFSHRVPESRPSGALLSLDNISPMIHWLCWYVAHRWLTLRFLTQGTGTPGGLFCSFPEYMERLQSSSARYYL